MAAAFLIAIAVSIDSFSIGIAYGIKGLRIPAKSIIIVSLISFTTVLLSMALGNAMANLMSEYVAKVFSSIILVILALWMWKQSKPSKGTVQGEGNDPKRAQIILNIRLKSLGVVINILKEPSKADVDISGTIESKEALLLGMALSLDSLGVGVGAAVAGANILLTPFLVVIFSIAFIVLGINIGQRHKLLINKNLKVRYLPSLILVFVAILRIIK
jgi:putative sporulation protein YtaF